MKNRTGLTGRTCLLTLTCLFVSSVASNTTAQEKVTPDEAKAIAKEAYIFNYPVLSMGLMGI